MKYSKSQDSVYCAPCRFFGPHVNCIRFQIKLNPLHIWQNKISTYFYYIALLNILFLKIYVQKLTCCSWKLGFRGIIFSARKLQECRILYHLSQSRKATSARWGRVVTLHQTFKQIWVHFFFGVATPLKDYYEAKWPDDSSTTWWKCTDCVRYGGIPRWHSSNWSSLVWCIQPISAFNIWSVNVNCLAKTTTAGKLSSNSGPGDTGCSTRTTTAGKLSSNTRPGDTGCWK